MPNHAASIQLCVQKLRILIEDSDQNCKLKNYFLSELRIWILLCISEIFGTSGNVQDLENSSKKRPGSQRFDPTMSRR